jgi:thiol-disulfide isomerase/thioredoxin
MRKYHVIIFSFLFAINLAAQITVEKVDKAGLAKIIKERNDKVLLLNIWATWCAPCREEFPDLNKIAGEYGSKNVEVIGISIDFSEDIKSKVIPFLKKQKANFVNYVSAFKNDEELIYFVNKDWNGALPATIIYDREGKQISFMSGKRTYKEFSETIKICLNKSS